MATACRIGGRTGCPGPGSKRSSPGAAGFFHNPRLDRLAANQLGYALYSDMLSRPTGPDVFQRWIEAAGG